MTRSFRRSFSSRRSRGFTLLELTIAMMFVALLAGGIVITISTALRVWHRAMRTAELYQEARAVTALLTRDIRGASMGLPPKDAGYFIGGDEQLGLEANTSSSPADTLELTTESSSLSEVALLPEEARQNWNPETRPPVSDLLGVRWEWRPEDGRKPAGLYRMAMVAPTPEPEIDLETGTPIGLASDELISTAATELRLRYYDGEQWQTTWDSREQQNTLPAAVEISLTLADQDPRGRERTQEYTFSTVVPIAAR